MFSCSSSSSMEWETDEEATSSASPSLYTILGVDITVRGLDARWGFWARSERPVLMQSQHAQHLCRQAPPASRVRIDD